MSIMTATIPKCLRHNNNKNLINAYGNINYNTGPICANSSQVSAKSNKNCRNGAAGKFHINRSNSLLTDKRSVASSNGLLLLAYLLSAAVVLEADSIAADLEYQTIAPKGSSNITANAEFIAKSFEEQLTITTTDYATSVPYTALTPPTLPSPHSVTSATTPSTVSLSSPKVPASAPLEANTIESATVEPAKEDSHEIASPDIQPPPPSDVLIKGFSIPTFLPPFPKFAMADLPAFTSPPTIPKESEDELYSAAYLNNIQQPNTSVRTTNITMQMGNHAYLPCKIQRMLNKPISWVRLRDGHILSVDQATFIADQRFQSIFQGDNDYTWSMQIKYVQKTDEGWYECQAATEPKMSAKVYLTVVVPHTELIGDQIRFVKAGSKVALHCIIRDTLDPPTYIIWFRGKAQITNDNQMGWYTEIDRAIFGNVESKRNTIGSLIIPFVRKNDSGNYTCEPSNSAPVSVDLHVLSGEYSASAIMSAADSYQLIQSISICNLFIVLPLILVLQKA
ncbi:uncharacterized protein LOC101454775 [Ceratitis capitata]|nr:uncharacterized protein LOC101454775 [Ceratitis capitata]